MRGVFIVLEGPDRSGKSTQARMLARHFKTRRAPFLHTREPGGTSLAEALRRILLDTRVHLRPLAELFLYEAARAQHTEEKILPALKAGRIVLSERYTLATLAYQGYGRGLPLGLVRRLNAAASLGIKPDLTFILDLPEKKFTERGGSMDRIEREGEAFRRRVRRGYRALAKTERPLVVLDARRPAAELHDEIVRRIERLSFFKKRA